MVEVQDITFGTLVGDVRVRVDLTKIGKEFGGAAIVARGHRREYLGGAVVVEAFNVLEVKDGTSSSS
jgi:hypothetical protein